jgi:hypothetical protein
MPSKIIYFLVAIIYFWWVLSIKKLVKNKPEEFLIFDFFLLLKIRTTRWSHGELGCGLKYGTRLFSTVMV